ncbi:Uncharacterised protein [Candidatus Bilamarchaeum dharawalense]|uniref:Uncharacterized protein n=1 Tax=Candidatus Bilamarchaeum dharawalense TaxID=2885759 RepID=A0A5E4LT16_9ARCH|nr:Uncharacterised protein [Candidatus Bilamarchaeum dharawalense]
MRVKTGIILAAAGAAMLYYGHSQMNREYSAESVFQRTKPKIEMLMRADPSAQERMIQGLKSGLKGAKDDTERCKIGLLADASAHARGDMEVAKKIIDRRSLTPYAECEPEARADKSPNKWYNYGGWGAIALAAISLVTSLVEAIRRRGTATP